MLQKYFKWSFHQLIFVVNICSEEKCTVKNGCLRLRVPQTFLLDCTVLHIDSREPQIIDAHDFFSTDQLMREMVTSRIEFWNQQKVVS